jgi:2-oxoisovalerate dehydrogenase E1 component beta subunit
MRIRGEELIPGEPADEKTLKSMIDAPVQGDRGSWKAKWPELQEYAIRIGEGKITREGDKATIVSYGRTMPLCNRVADMLREEGTAVEVIDMRSLYPYDWQMIKASIEKTGRVLFLNEDTEVTNFGEHLAYRATEELFYQLMARPRVIAGKNLPGIGLSPNLEKASVPQSHDVEKAIREIIAEVP